MKGITNKFKDTPNLMPISEIGYEVIKDHAKVIVVEKMDISNEWRSPARYKSISDIYPFSKIDRIEYFKAVI